MSNVQQKIVDMICQPQLACLATITRDGKPWVRYVFCTGSKDMSIRFASFCNSRKVAQINNNPEVHLTCGVTDPRSMGPYLQIQGRATLNTSKEARHGFWSDMLKAIFSGPDDPNYAVLEIKPYYVEYVSPGVHEPEVWQAR
jgi:general stress protein 26